MKKFVFTAFIFSSIISAKAQNTTGNNSAGIFRAYQISYDSDHLKVLKGLITRSDIENDTSFSWFKKNYHLGRPDATAVEAFKNHANDFHVLIFCGTWCSDTHNLLPQFYRLADAAGYPDSCITLIGVDDAKITLNNLNTAFHLVDVPTFIILKNGKEVGRVVEYGESGDAMHELLDSPQTLDRFYAG